MDKVETLRHKTATHNKLIYEYLQPNSPSSNDVIQKELKLRLRVLVWVYAEEIQNYPLVTKSIIDIFLKRIDTSIKLGDLAYDTFFETEFDPDERDWITKFPDIPRIARYFTAYILHERTLKKTEMDIMRP